MAQAEALFEKCTVNPGHVKFFTVENLVPFLDIIPDFYRNDPDVMELLKYQAKLTVKIWLEDIDVAGTGFIYDVKAYPPNSKQRCYCKGKDELYEFAIGEIYIRTAHHVLGKNAQCFTTGTLFSDDMYSDTVKIVSIGQKDSNPENDTICLVCVTCKSNILRDLGEFIVKYTDIRNKLSFKYESKPSTDIVAIIASHPHGYYKRVTKGRFHYEVEKDEKSVNYNRRYYDAPVCDGTSGADVLQLGGINIGSPVVHRGWDTINGRRLNYGQCYNLLKSKCIIM